MERVSKLAREHLTKEEQEGIVQLLKMAVTIKQQRHLRRAKDHERLQDVYFGK